MERRARTSEAALSIELRRVESAHAEGARLLQEFAQAHEVKTAHLGALQEQTARSTSMLAAMQEQAAVMQKRLAASQRRSLRLQESQSVLDATQRTWTAERSQLIEAAQTAGHAAREATARQHSLEQAHAALVREVEAERQHSIHTLRHQRDVAASSEASLRGELRGLQALHEALLHDTTRVTLKNGHAGTVKDHVRSLAERQQRQRRANALTPAQPIAPTGDDAPAAAQQQPPQTPRSYLRAESGP